MPSTDTRIRTRGPRDSRQRRGAAVIEFAVCLPVIVLLVLGSIEATSFIFLKQSLQTAAYEGTRHAIRRGATRDEAEGRVHNILDARRVRGANIQFPLGDPDSADRGALVAVQVAAPASTNSPLGGRFISNRTLTVRTVMVKE